MSGVNSIDKIDQDQKETEQFKKSAGYGSRRQTTLFRSQKLQNESNISPISPKDSNDGTPTKVAPLLFKNNVSRLQSRKMSLFPGANQVGIGPWLIMHMERSLKQN